MLEPRLVLFVAVRSSLHHVVQLGAVEEVACVLEDVLRPIVDGLPDKNLHQAQQLGVGAEVLLVFNS